MLKNTAAITLQASRSKARASLWSFLEEDRDIGPVTPAGKTAAARAASGRATANVAQIKRVGIYKIDIVSAQKIVKRGISSRAITPLGDFLGLGKGTVAEYLDLDRGTANRRAAKGQLLPMHAAEGVVRLLELDQMASDTFEEEAEASQWLRKPHPMLEGETPLEAAKTSYGAQRVKDILLAIKYGGVV